MKKIYFDNNATTAAHPAVSEIMARFLDAKQGLYGNPSSVHTFGQAARKAVDDAREKVAKLIGADTDEIIFTSCGSESDNLAIKGAVFAAKERNKGNHIIASSIEHDTVISCCEYLRELGVEVTFLPANPHGLIHPDDVRKAIKPGTILVTVMHANNETGVIQPAAEIGRICRERDILFHTDAVQTVGKITVNVDSLNADLLSLSAHKFYGPKGAGALYARKGTRLHPLIHGHHEKNRRAGTENVPAIAGMGVACELAEKGIAIEKERTSILRDALESGILENIPGSSVNGARDKRVPGTANINFDCVEGEALVVALDIEGIAVSTGAACATGSAKSSHVLRAMGMPGNIAQSSIRFSLGIFNTEEEVNTALEIIPKAAERLRSITPVWMEKANK